MLVLGVKWSRYAFLPIAAAADLEISQNEGYEQEMLHFEAM